MPSNYQKTVNLYRDAWNLAYRTDNAYQVFGSRFYIKENLDKRIEKLKANPNVRQIHVVALKPTMRWIRNREEPPKVDSV